MDRNSQGEPDDRVSQAVPARSTRPLHKRLQIEFDQVEHTLSQASEDSSRLLSFEHNALNHSVDSIRLFTVSPELLAHDHIQGHMRHTTIESSKYMCLSYEWGPEEGGDWISINRKLHYVRQNLLDFLQVARKHHHSSPLWIDALCIDQDNNT
jgi:hypothetical protein